MSVRKKKEGLFINGVLYSIKGSKDINLQNVLEKFLKKKIDYKLAIAVNEELIPRTKWQDKKLSINDKIEIVYPFKGG